MNAMILAAGRGERLRPLTDHQPKPLVKVRGRPVIDYTLEHLARLNIRHVVINACYLAEQLMDYVGDGSAWNIAVTWSHEKSCLDTGGGVVHALCHVGDLPFLVVNGDILWTLDLRPLLTTFDVHSMDGLLALVTTPTDREADFLYTEPDPSSQNRAGFLVRAAGRPVEKDQKRVTYSGIQVLRPQALSEYPDTPFSLNRFYDDALTRGRLRGLWLPGRWSDMGTIERLEKAQKYEWTSDHF